MILDPNNLYPPGISLFAQKFVRAIANSDKVNTDVSAENSIGLTYDAVIGFLFKLLSIIRHSDNQENYENELLADLVSQSDVALDNTSQEKLITRLKSIARCPLARLLSKNIDIQQKYANLFKNTKIITDIRPIFGNDIDDSVEAAVLTHTLSHDFLRSGEHKYICYSIR